MWAQYADDSSGVCLVLERAHLESTLRSIQEEQKLAGGFGNVTYAKPHDRLGLGFVNLTALAVGGPRAVFAQNATEVLLTKHADWAHENEARAMLLEADDDAEVARIMPLNPADVPGVILGPKFDRAHDPTIAAFASTFEVETVCQLSWVTGLPELHRVELD